VTVPVLSSADVLAAATYLETQAGLVFDEGRRPALKAILERRLAASGMSDAASYLWHLDTVEGAVERQHLLDAVTIQETYFFRNGPQMEALRHHVLPDLVRAAAAQRRPLRVWSAGCSTGEEPYTLAMLITETMERLGIFTPVEVIGTDVSAAAIEHAQTAIYRGRTLEMAESSARERWFVDAGDGRQIVDPEIRSVVELRVHNLVTDAPPFDDGIVDLVVCRNVTIYFAKPTTGRIIERFRDVLAPHGHLLLGHSETLWQVSDDFDLFPLGEAFVYRKADLAARERAAAQQQKKPVARTAQRRTARPTPRSFIARRSRSSVVEISAPKPQKRTSHAEALKRAISALDEGRYDVADEQARQAIRLDPLVAEAYAVAGRAAVAVGDDVAALEPLRKAVFLEPGCAEAHFTLAGVLQRTGQAAAAAASYRAAGAAVVTTNAERLQRMLDGRDPASLAALCEQLAQAAERSADAYAAGGA
jgi:chemotaxis protein methyltransferase CheR